MLDKLKDVFSELMGTDDVETSSGTLDKNTAAAALMVQVMVADGKVTPEEEAKLNAVLAQHYALTPEDAKKLAEQARVVQDESIDLHSFTSLIKQEMSEGERQGLIEDLWEMVYADGEVHEFEDNIVWRVAELVGISSRHRMELKQRVQSRLQSAGS